MHVLSEIPAGVSIEECKGLVAAAKKSKASYMLAENMNYVRELMFINGMADAGLFGKLFYAEAEYMHDCKELSEQTPCAGNGCWVSTA